MLSKYIIGKQNSQRFEVNAVILGTVKCWLCIGDVVSSHKNEVSSHTNECQSQFHWALALSSSCLNLKAQCRC